MEQLECDSCGKSEGQMNRCADCEHAIYCGAKCQEQDWIAGHAEDCFIDKGIRSKQMRNFSSIADAQSALSTLEAESVRVKSSKGLQRFRRSRSLKRHVAAFVKGATALKSKLSSQADQSQVDQMINTANSLK